MINKLRLPKNPTLETIEVIGTIYEKIGSIRNCKNIYDFGRYRLMLVKEYDKVIRKLKRNK